MSKIYGLPFPIGETLIGSHYPIMFDPHYPIMTNNPPVTLITGSPRSGKTFFGLLLAAYSSIAGKVSFIIDYKGDFLNLKKLEQAGEINKVQVWSALNESGEVDLENMGILDPTIFYSSVADNVTLTIDVIRTLVGGLTDKQRAYLVPVIKDILEGDKPSFGRVVQKIMSNRDDEIRALSFDLDSILKSELGKLLLANKRVQRKSLDIQEGTIVVNLAGLELPTDTNYKRYSAKHKISLVIMQLLSSLVVDIMKNRPKKEFKTLFVDEAWLLFISEIGKRLFNTVSLMGGSMNLATILMTQAPEHIVTDIKPTDDNDSSDTTISSRFAFQNRSAKSRVKTVTDMGLPTGEGWEELLASATTGECLFQDCKYSYAYLHIIAPEKWAMLFETNPTKIGE